MRVVERTREVWAYREILLNLVRKELKVKYTASVLGAVWSVLNPIVFLAVFYFVVVMLGNNLPDFPVFLLSGLLGWNFLNASLLNGARSVVDNGNLVKKVYFPREILPLATIGVAAVDLVLQSMVLLVWIVLSGHGFRLAALVLYPLSLVGLLVFTLATTFWVAALNVRYRDVQHLLNLGLLVWFWLTPIVYACGLVWTNAHMQKLVLGIPLRAYYFLNPMTPITVGFQRALYGNATMPASSGTIWVLPPLPVGEMALIVGAVIVASLALLLATWRLFFNLSGDFAEEL